MWCWRQAQVSVSQRHIPKKKANGYDTAVVSKVGLVNIIAICLTSMTLFHKSGE